MIDRPLVVVDVETTGLSPRFGDRIVEIAVLRVEDGREVSFESLVNPRSPISPRATAVHGITQEMVAAAPRIAELGEQIWALLDGAVLVGHNVLFDLSFLNTERRLLGLPTLGNPAIDTLALARRHFSFSRNSLTAIAEALAIPQPVQHRALADVRTTWEVLKRFLSELAQRGISTLESLYLPPAVSPQDEALLLPPELGEALSGPRRLELRYVSAQQVETVRDVEPFEVIPLGDALYLRAFCHLRQDERTFRLDRIISMKLAAEEESGTHEVRGAGPGLALTG